LFWIDQPYFRSNSLEHSRSTPKIGVMVDRLAALLRKDRDLSAGLLLIAATVLALIAENSPLQHFYRGFLETPVSVEVGSAGLAKPMLLWINDGLMAIFFLLIGLEIKRELIEGHLRDIRQLVLPAAGALGGMAVPAMVYVLVNLSDERLLTGWAIPSATDIAFALGILAMFGSRIPTGLKAFLMLAAVFDDVGAIIVIALFYSGDLAPSMLAAASIVLLGLFVLNRLHVHKIWPYAVLGVVLWVCVLKSGVHATLAGIVVALAIPMERLDDRSDYAAVGRRIEYELHSLVGFIIVPIFAFANAGLSFSGLSFGALFGPVPLGIALGLFIGKQVGMFVPSLALIRTGHARLPDGVSWLGFYGACVMAGVGFTMSLFIGSLAFDNLAAVSASDVSYTAQVRLGVLVGSVLSAIAGSVLLYLGTDKRLTAAVG
jgi:NhaA family Na+:H+ antiporter